MPLKENKRIRLFQINPTLHYEGIHETRRKTYSNVPFDKYYRVSKNVLSCVSEKY